MGRDEGGAIGPGPSEGTKMPIVKGVMSLALSGFAHTTGQNLSGRCALNRVMTCCGPL
jgi:hypothetical protein